MQLDIACQGADALARLHHLTIVHGDIKPANLMITERVGSALATVKLADFGLARSCDTTMSTMTRRHTDDGRSAGTLMYMAPGVKEHGAASLLCGALRAASMSSS